MRSEGQNTQKDDNALAAVLYLLFNWAHHKNVRLISKPHGTAGLAQLLQHIWLNHIIRLVKGKIESPTELEACDL